MAQKNDTIAVMDSGIGGISVLRELVALMPRENYLYLGDSRNIPYGTKSAEKVRRLTFSHVEYLLARGAKAVVIACNTATSAAARELREAYPEVPIIGIEPALKPAIESKPQAKVAVLATPLTLSEEKFHTLMEKYRSQSTIIPVPCPGLVELIEQGVITGERLTAYLKQTFAAYDLAGLDAVVLGCTHYSFIKQAITDALGGAAVFDGGLGTARETQRRLAEAGLLNDAENEGTIEMINTLGTPESVKLSFDLLEMNFL